MRYSGGKMEQYVSLYEQIYKKYRRMIEEGVYKEGEQLPSVRSEALSLGVNPNTVLRAYRRLEEEGFIGTVPKKGIYVRYKAESTENSRKSFLISEITRLEKLGYTLDEIEEAVCERGKQDA